MGTGFYAFAWLVDPGLSIQAAPHNFRIKTNRRTFFA
jgi:hypothetical protein